MPMWHSQHKSSEENAITKQDSETVSLWPSGPAICCDMTARRHRCWSAEEVCEFPTAQAGTTVNHSHSDELELRVWQDCPRLLRWRPALAWKGRFEWGKSLNPFSRQGTIGHVSRASELESFFQRNGLKSIQMFLRQQRLYAPSSTQLLGGLVEDCIIPE